MVWDRRGPWCRVRAAAVGFPSGDGCGVWDADWVGRAPHGAGTRTPRVGSRGWRVHGRAAPPWRLWVAARLDGRAMCLARGAAAGMPLLSVSIQIVM